MQSIDERINRHNNFLRLHDVDRPLFGCCVGGWENLSRYTSDPELLIPVGIVDVSRLSPSSFDNVYDQYIYSFQYDDDLIRCITPFQSIPWTEAAIGCPVSFTGKNLWAGKIIKTIDDVFARKILENENPVILKYTDFLSFLKFKYAQRIPVGQAILRGPLDMLSAAIGEENMIYNLVDRPDAMQKFLFLCTEIFIKFLKTQSLGTPLFNNGHVIGQYDIWTPGPCARLQDDAMLLLSPNLFEEFAAESCHKISQATSYNLFHIHASALFLIDFILADTHIQIIQVSKDEGLSSIESIINKLHQIQAAGKCLLLKGRFSQNDISLMKSKLDKRGLCIQAVVNNFNDADSIMTELKSAWQ